MPQWWALSMFWIRDTATICGSYFTPSSQRRDELAVPRWVPPDPGWIKANTDASFHADRNNGATTCVFRDHHGMFLSARVSWYDWGFDACMMEVLACTDALSTARKIGLQLIRLDTDCLELVHLWEKKEKQRSVIGPIPEEIDDLGHAFHDFQVPYISRSCNNVARTLAKQITNTSRLEVWHVSAT
jgi:ribonuclease HI